MTLQTVFFEFMRSESPAKELNQTLSVVRERFKDTGHRIINVETVEPQTFMGLQLKAGGLRIWFESQPSPTPVELVQPLWDQVSSQENTAVLPLWYTASPAAKRWAMDVGVVRLSRPGIEQESTYEH